MQTDVLRQRQKDCHPSFAFSAHFVLFCFGKDLLRTLQKLWRGSNSAAVRSPQNKLYCRSSPPTVTVVASSYGKRASHPPTKDTFSANARCMLQHALLRVRCSYSVKVAGTPVCSGSIPLQCSSFRPSGTKGKALAVLSLPSKRTASNSQRVCASTTLQTATANRDAHSLSLCRTSGTSTFNWGGQKLCRL